jgi:hypothetical protein
MQTPEITDLAVRTAVKNAKLGQVSNVVSKTRTVPAEKIFEYALEELDGYCAEKDLYNEFKKQGARQNEIREILQEYEVAGTPPALEPELELGKDEELYYLAPSPGGRNPRQLIPVDKFVAEFEDKWADILARRALRVTQNGKTNEGETVKISKTQQPEKVAEL